MGIGISKEMVDCPFRFIDDGTCQIQGDYGQGKWSIVDEDTLKLTDFYGETRTYPITAVDDNSLELELPNGETVTYYQYGLKKR